MEKKITILTLNGNSNYGNKLQNYALTHFLAKNGIQSKTFWYDYGILRRAKHGIRCLFQIKEVDRRERMFEDFTKKYLSRTYRIRKDECRIVGSDQIWNPYWAADNQLLLSGYEGTKIAYAASFGVEKLPDNQKKRFREALMKFDAISVREDAGKRIIEDLTGRNDVKVLVDPTMLLTDEEWNMVSRCPSQYRGEKYVLKYFLGDDSEAKSAIDEFSRENDLKVIDILDRSSRYYITGPSEFLWLEKHAELICTDSFHSSVFAILYNRPFVVFDRVEDGMGKMNSRIDTLLSKFKVDGRRFDGKKVTEANLNWNYDTAYTILKDERIRSKKFLEDALTKEWDEK